MRARITVAIVLLLGVALALSGGVSLLLVRHAASNDAQLTVYRQATELKSILDNPKSSIAGDSQVITAVESIAGVVGAPPVVVSPKGKLLSAPAANGVTGAIDLQVLAHGQGSRGVHNHIAFAAVPLLSSNAGTVALVFESKESFSSESVWYFLLASGVSLLGAGILASLLSSRLAARVITVADASEQIAEGDLSTRVPVGDQRYPELERLDRAINTMAENLERAREGERAFLLSISHDLRTPLTSIRGYAEAIADGAVHDLPRAARVVVSEAGRLERLIGDLLDLARLRTRQFSFDHLDLDMANLVRTGTEAFRYEFEASGVELVFTIPDEPVEFLGDPHRIGQIVANLTENALKFAEHRVEIGLVPGEETLSLSVTDDGPGIDAEDLPHVFEWLYSSTRYVARAAGTGLGLAIVTELANAMGASVTVDSPVATGRGTRFSVHFPTPRTTDPAAPVAIEAETEPSASTR